MDSHSKQDPAANQLSNWKSSKQRTDRLVSEHGVPLPSQSKALTVGPRGPILLQDTHLIDHLAAWERERIPERVVHAKGAGAFGYFETTHDIRRYTKACPFQYVGKRTNVAVRFSTVGGESGSADTVRDPRGFAVKFYTEDGNWDLTGNNTPIFFVRDPMVFPSFIRVLKRNPETNLKDPDMFWDFVGLRPETVHQTCLTYSDRGIPDGFRYMNGYGSHTFKLVNEGGHAVYCKFHWKSNQGIRNLSPKVAHQLSADDPDYATHDLYNAIHEQRYPSWTLNIQVMTFEQAEKLAWNPFDLTKIWPQKDFPLIPVGKLTLNRNPTNYFVDVEQMAYNPANMVPGIEPSPDKMLQARLFAYADTHRHRLGPNYAQLPVNCPMKSIPLTNYRRAGFMNADTTIGGAPNYFPNSFGGPTEVESATSSTFHLTGDVQRYESIDDDNFSQAKVFWTRVLDDDGRGNLAINIADHLSQAKPFIQQRVIQNFAQVHPDLAAGIQKRLENITAEKYQKLNYNSHL